MAILRSLLVSAALLLPCVLHAESESPQTPGPLIIAGGGTLPDRIYDRFVELAKDDEARILIIPQASENADAGSRGKAIFENRPHQSISILDLADRDAALKAIAQATGIWITGGQQNRLMKLLRETDGVVEAIRKRHHAGIVIGGSSAGAAVMSDLMIAGDDLPLDRGLALWPEAIVDQHFAARKRLQR